jgi:pimeloyl-ACP methyl ester carboxylesterase
MPIAERWTDRSGPRIRFLDNSPTVPVGLPILFSPGLSDLAEEYLEMLEFFVPRRVLVVEVRGRGQSEAPSSGYTVADHSADLEAVLDEAAIARCHLMTFSRGTSWALDLAISNPDRVASLSIGDYRAEEVALPPGFAEGQLRTRFRGRPMADRIPRHVLERLAADSTARELWDELAALPCPLLVARPSGDRGILNDDLIARYRSARPDVEVIVVPDARHDLFRPDRLFYPRAVSRFLDRC